MLIKKLTIDNIPAMVWGDDADKVYIYVHGKMSRKEDAQEFSEIACSRGYQVISFDLPEHGERNDPSYKCDVWNGVSDLSRIKNYALARWDRHSLFGCSLGAYFSLLAFDDVAMDKCLFYSPILDMERLIANMMKWFNVSEAELEEKQEIQTPIGEMLSWKYYTYVKIHRVKRWDALTHIIYGANDNLTERETIEGFCSRFRCTLTVIEEGNHFFTTPSELDSLRNWYLKSV